jgi:hypothetical protein
MLSSCSGDDYINAIPESSTLLMSTNTAKLTGVGSQQLLKSLLHFKNIDKTGIDFSANVYFFEDARYNIGLCAKVSDDDKLADMLQQAGCRVEKRRGFRFALLQGNWIVGFSDVSVLLMGPVIPAAIDEMKGQMVQYLKQSEDESIKGTPLMERLQTIDAPMAMVCQASALPEQFITPFTIGAPRDASPSDIMIAASMEVSHGRLLISGQTFSFKKQIDEALQKAQQTYRPIKGDYVKTMSTSDGMGLFMNIDGKNFHKLIRQNRGVSTMLMGINTAIDMDNIIKSIDGDMALIASGLGNDKLQMMMGAKLGNSNWLKDVAYWKQSVPKGGRIGDWGKNCFYYTGNQTAYYFGVTNDMQYMSGGSKDEALRSIRPSQNPINTELQQLIIGNKLVMLINFEALKDQKAQAITSMLKPLFGELNTIVYTMK